MIIKITPMVQKLLILNIFLFVLSLIFPQLISIFALYNLNSTNFQIYQLVSYAFFHNDFIHIFFNMMVLFFIGSFLEKNESSKKFLLYFFIPLIFGALITSTLAPLLSPQENMGIGASIATWGILTIFALKFPQEIIYFFIFPFKAWILVLILFAFEVFMLNNNNNISHLGHISGAICGLLTYLIFDKKFRILGSNSKKIENEKNIII